MANSKESYREDGKADALAGKPPRYEKRGSWQSLAYLESYDAAIREQEVYAAALPMVDVTETKRESSNCGNPSCTGCSKTAPRVSVPAINKDTGAVGEIILPKSTVDKLVGLSENFKVLKGRPRPVGGLEYEAMQHARRENTLNALRSHIRSLMAALQSRPLPFDRYERLHKSLEKAQRKLTVAKNDLYQHLYSHPEYAPGATYRASESA